MAGLASVAGALACALPAFAHQPQNVDGQTRIEVASPEISKAYYGTLTGQPVTYHIHASAPFAFYVNTLVPKLPDAKTDLTVDIRKDGVLFTRLDPANKPWTVFYEPFGGDTYLMGPEYRAQAPAGEYDLTVSQPGNQGTYVLAIGETEAFSFTEIVRTMIVLPEIKRVYFRDSLFDSYGPRTVLPIAGVVLALGGVVLLVFCIVRKLRRA